MAHVSVFKNNGLKKYIVAISDETKSVCRVRLEVHVRGRAPSWRLMWSAQSGKPASAAIQAIIAEAVMQN